VPVYSKNHAVKILEILNEIFNDIDEHSLHVSDSSITITFSEEFFTRLEELLFCDYVEFQKDLPDPDALPE